MHGREGWIFCFSDFLVMDCSATPFFAMAVPWGAGHPVFSSFFRGNSPFLPQPSRVGSCRDSPLNSKTPSSESTSLAFVMPSLQNPCLHESPLYELRSRLTTPLNRGGNETKIPKSNLISARQPTPRDPSSVFRGVNSNAQRRLVLHPPEALNFSDKGRRNPGQSSHLPYL